ASHRRRQLCGAALGDRSSARSDVDDPAAAERGHRLMSYISPAAEGTDFYVPHFEISLHGKDLDPTVIYDVTEVSYRDSLTDVDAFDLTLANYDSSSPTYASTATRTFKYSDQDLF